MGWLGYLLFFGVVAGAFTLIFVRVSGSWRIAIGVVTFMIAYMVLMGRITGKGLDGGGDQPGMRR